MNQIGKLMNGIPDSRLLISILPGSALRMHFELLSKPRESTSLLEALPGKLDIKRHSPSILYIYFYHYFKVLCFTFSLKGIMQGPLS